MRIVDHEEAPDAGTTDQPLNPFRMQDLAGQVPLPTLYAGTTTHQGKSAVGPSGTIRPPSHRMGAIELLLYNMAAMLAGVAAGYDVRLSNVTPIHPSLHPKRYIL